MKSLQMNHLIRVRQQMKIQKFAQLWTRILQKDQRVLTRSRIGLWKPCLEFLKNLKLDSTAKSWADTEIVKVLEERFLVQAEIMKFLAIQGLFSASLGTEVPSFELQEKFKWPKAAISGSLCRMCIQKLKLLLEDAQKGEVSSIISSSLERNDLGSYFMCFLKTLCNIPSVTLYRALSEKDEEAFKKLQETEYWLLQEERNGGSSVEENKLHALRYVLVQLVLQVLLCPNEFYEAASELVICCNKAFPAAAAHGGSSGEENELDDNEMPDLMDVLLETFLSLLPHSSGSMCSATEQAFRLCCDDLTIDGILRMLHVVRKDLKPLRYHTHSSDDDMMMMKTRMMILLGLKIWMKPVTLRVSRHTMRKSMLRTRKNAWRTY